MRHSIRQLGDVAGLVSGAMWWLERRMRDRLTILMYHRVLPEEKCVDYPFPSLVMPLSAFRQQVSWLAAHCRVEPLPEALSAAQTKRRQERPLVAITFDDGYDDNYLHAAPALEAAGLRGTFFLTTRFVGEREMLWFDRAALAWQGVAAAKQASTWEPLSARLGGGAPAPVTMQKWIAMLKECHPSRRRLWIAAVEANGPQEPRNGLYDAMTRHDASDLSRRGHTIASHTVSHPLLPQLDDEALTGELAASRREISDWISAPVDGLAYPNGDTDGRVIAAARAAGYTWACTTRAGSNGASDDPMTLNRIDITPQRVMAGGRPRPLGFRAEVCRWREAYR